MSGISLKIRKVDLKHMRLFVAIEVPEGIRMKLGALGASIRQDGVVPVGAENMHITLQFIGETEKSDEIAAKLAQVRFKAFDCVVADVGVFPNPEYIKVVWAGIQSQNGLEGLAQAVSGSLKGLGKDERFSPHITIARVRRKMDLSRFLKENERQAFGSFRVSSFRLMRSELGPGGPKYTMIEDFKAED